MPGGADFAEYLSDAGCPLYEPTAADHVVAATAGSLTAEGLVVLGRCVHR